MRLSVLALAFFAGACRLNPDCFGSDECARGFVCSGGVCLDSSQVDGGPRNVTWYRDVEPIVTQRCQICHGLVLANGAPMPLVAYENTRIESTVGTPVFQAMADRTASGTNPMPPVGRPGLSADQIRVIGDWALLGGPAGSPAQRPDSGVAGPNPLQGVAAPAMIQTGFVSLYGLAWGQDAELLVFGDPGANVMYGLRAPGVISQFRTSAGTPRGMVVDATNQLYVAEGAGRRITVTLGGSLVTTATDVYMTQHYNSPGFITARADGTLYFSDPSDGLNGRPRELAFNGLFRFPPGAAEPVAEWRGSPSTAPSGVDLSPSGSVLYLADEVDSLVRAFDVAVDGSLSNERTLALTAEGPRGIAVDSGNNIWVATSEGVEVYNAEGGRFGALPVAQRPTGLAFGGGDRTVLFIAAGTGLYRTSVSIPGR